MSIRNILTSPFLAGLLVVGCSFVMCVDDAQAQRRGGGGGGASRGGGGGGSARAGNHGGRTAQSSVSGGNRSGSSSRSASNSGNRTASGGDRTRTSGDRTTNVGSNNNVNIEGRDVNIDVEGGCCGGGGWGYRHPIAAGVTIGAIAGSVAASYGSYYYALPPSGCTVVVKNGAQYHYCGNAYYSEAMNGDEVVYVSVNP